MAEKLPWPAPHLPLMQPVPEVTSFVPSVRPCAGATRSRPYARPTGPGASHPPTAISCASTHGYWDGRVKPRPLSKSSSKHPRIRQAERSTPRSSRPCSPWIVSPRRNVAWPMPCRDMPSRGRRIRWRVLPGGSSTIRGPAHPAGSPSRPTSSSSERFGCPRRGACGSEPPMAASCAQPRRSEEARGQTGEARVQTFAIPLLNLSIRGPLIAEIDGTAFFGSSLAYPPDFALDGRCHVDRRRLTGWVQLGWAPTLSPELVIEDERGGRQSASSRPGEADARRHHFELDLAAAGLRGSRITVSARLPDGRLEALPDAPLLLARAVPSITDADSQPTAGGISCDRSHARLHADGDRRAGVPRARRDHCLPRIGAWLRSTLRRGWWW